MKKYKVVFAGPVGAGKSAAVRSVVGLNSLQTERPTTNAVSLWKRTTTVAMDYGAVKLETGQRVHLYGTPGQERFDFMWDILLENCDSIILLLNHSRADPLQDLRFYAKAFARHLPNKQCVIGVTHVDVSSSGANLDALRQVVEELGIQAEVFAVDARRKSDVLCLIQQVTQVKTISLAPETPVVNDIAIDAIAMDDTATHADDSPNKLANNATDTPKLNETLLALLDQVGAVPGVSGITLTNPMGDLLYSTIEDEHFNEFIAFLSGLAPVLAETLGMGKMQRIMLKSSQSNNVSLFMNADQSLGVLSRPKSSQHGVGRQVEKLLQWH